MRALDDRYGSKGPSRPARARTAPRPPRAPGWLVGIAALYVAAGSAANAQAPDARPACASRTRIPGAALAVAAHDGRFSVYAAGVPLCAVLSAVAAEAGLTLAGGTADDRRITLRLENQRLGRLLDRLLGDGSYVLVLTEGASASRGSIRLLAPAPASTARVGEPPADDAAVRRTTPSAEAVARDATADDRRARRAAVESAAELDEAAAASVLTGALADPDPAVREAAVETLAMLDTAGARALLYAALDDADPDVRLEVVDTLGDHRDAASTAALERALADPDARVREAAADYLAENWGQRKIVRAQPLR